MNKPIDHVLSRFQKVKALGGAKWQACCSAHEDKTPSLSIGLSDNGNILLHCHAGCTTEEVLDAAGLQWGDISNGGNMPRLAPAKASPSKQYDPQTIWDKFAPATAEHRYIKHKGGLPNGLRVVPDESGLRIAGQSAAGFLVIPVYSIDGELQSLQFIPPPGTGKKLNLPGATMSGGFYPAGELKGRVYLVEGIGQAWAISKAGATAVVCFGWSNVQKVAAELKRSRPDLSLVILPDSGKEAEAKKIASEIGAGVVCLPDGLPSNTDINDLLQQNGVEYVAAILAKVEHPKTERNNNGALFMPLRESAEYARDVNLIRASELTPEAISWLWCGWLAEGKMHVFGGAPGTGKTTISMGLAATVTTGGRWPDGTRAIAGNVVIWSGEDDPADTLIPRLILSGADLSRVYFIADIREGDERRSFDPARDMEPLRRKLAEIGGVKLLIVDPVVSAIAGDSHKNAEVRRGLQPLVDLAGSMRCALLGITHFSKGTGGRDPVERLTGSLAFGALARVVLVAAKQEEEGEDGRTVRLFCRAKSNIGPDSGGFEYDLEQGELKNHPGVFASAVSWGETIEGSAREILASADSSGEDHEGGTLGEAKRFLADLLSDGPMPVKTIRAEATDAGFSWASIRRAQKPLGIEAEKVGMRGGWQWALPRRCSTNSEDAQQKKVSTFGKVEHLQVIPEEIDSLSEVVE